MNEQIETVKAPAFDEATIAALMAAKTVAGEDVVIQTKEDFEGTPTVH